MSPGGSTGEETPGPDSITLSVYLCRFLFPGTKSHKSKAVLSLVPRVAPTGSALLFPHPHWGLGLKLVP